MPFGVSSLRQETWNAERQALAQAAASLSWIPNHTPVAQGTSNQETIPGASWLWGPVRYYQGPITACYWAGGDLHLMQGQSGKCGREQSGAYL